MKIFTPEQLKAILDMISRQSFADWYNEGGRFDRWITGETHMPTTEADILADLERMIGD